MTTPNLTFSLSHRLDRLRAWASQPKVFHAAALTATVLSGWTMLLILWLDYVPDGVVEVVASWQRADTEGRIRIASAGIGIVVVTWVARVSMPQVQKWLKGPSGSDRDSAGDC